MSHIGEVSGNVSNLKTLKVIDLTGEIRPVFVYSGNALRNGVLRRRGIAAAMDGLGLCVNPDVHHTLFAGGRLDGASGADLDLDSKIRQLMPWLSVLGTAKPAGVFGVTKSQMVQGRLNVGSNYLVCFETAAYLWSQFPGALPPEAQAGVGRVMAARDKLSSDPFTPVSTEALQDYKSVLAAELPILRRRLRTWTEFVQSDQTTRRDSTKDPTLVRFLPPEPPAGLLTGETAPAPEKEKSNQMIASDRLIVAGAQLYSRWDFHGTSVEEGFIYDALIEWGKSPYLGGKGNRGNGLCKMELWYQAEDGTRGPALTLDRGAALLTERTSLAHQRYTSYLDQYRQFLESARDSQPLRQLLGGAA
jgi:hypothetical protein